MVRLQLSSRFSSFVVAAALALPATAGAVETDPDDCTQYRSVSAGVYVQSFDETEVTGGIAGLPDRVTTDLAPGQSGRVCVGFQNRTGRTVALRFQAHDFGANEDGAPVPYASGDQRHGAGSWLELPQAPRVTVGHGDLVWLDIGVDIPLDTAGGSAYAGVSAVPVEDGEDAPDPEAASQAKISPSVVVQIFFDVPGEITSSGELEDVRSPRLVWWDGLDIGTISFLDRLRGPGIAPVRFRWRNTGSVSDDVGARLVIRSSLGGRTVADLKVPERIVLRDAERAYDVAWSKDIPFIGRFEPTLMVTRSDGAVEERELPAIWVIPSWWYLLALVLAIALPLWWRRRSRRRYDELVARVEAAEARAGDGEDDWDGDDGWPR